MKKTQTLQVLAIFLILYGNIAYAALIRLGGLALDTETGINWLPFEHTIGKSFEYVASNLIESGQYSGFRFATSDEIMDLYFHTLGIDPANTTRVGFEVLDAISILEPALGVTYEIEYSGLDYQKAVVAFNGYDGSAKKLLQSGMFLEVDCIHVLVDWTLPGNPSSCLSATAVGNWYVEGRVSVAPDEANSIRAAWLVSSSAIPNPSSLWLILIGLGLIIWRNALT